MGHRESERNHQSENGGKQMGSKLELQLGKLKFIVGIGGPIMSLYESAQERGQISSNIVKQASYWRSSTNRNNV